MIWLLFGFVWHHFQSRKRFCTCQDILKYLVPPKSTAGTPSAGQLPGQRTQHSAANQSPAAHPNHIRAQLAGSPEWSPHHPAGCDPHVVPQHRKPRLRSPAAARHQATPVPVAAAAKIWPSDWPASSSPPTWDPPVGWAPQLPA